MVPIGGKAFSVITVLWCIAVFTFIFVLLRFYTRIKVVDAYGIDDHFFNAAFVMLVIYCIFVTIAARYGFGQVLSAIPDHATITKAILWEAFGQTIVVFAVWVSKSSLAFFLLRLVTSRGQRIAIIFPNVVLCVSVTAALVAFWLGCRPIAFFWDRSISGGYCVPASTYVSDFAGAVSVFTDFWYAGFPWYMLRSVQMPMREKRLIQLSLSLGVLAGACGIERTVQLSTLSNPEYLRDTAPLIIWHAAELSVTMVCIGIPVCRPLYKGWFERLTTNKSDGKQRGDGSGQDDGVYTMHTIGGSKFKRPQQTEEMETLRLGKMISRSRLHKVSRPFGDNASDESIRGRRGPHQQMPGSSSEYGETETGVIYVKTDVEVRIST